MELNKKINRQGAISLPAALRREYGIETGEKVNISVDAEGQIVIKRIEGTCVFCQSDKVVKKYYSRYICKDCLEFLQGVQGV